MIRIVIGSEPRLVCVLRTVARHCSQQAGFPQAEAEHIALAIGEAAANIIGHTYRGDLHALLALEVRRFPDRLEFVMQDWGPKVREDQIRPRSLDELRPGGLGTLFINSFMDTCRYDPDCREGNRLKLVKFLSRKDACCNEGPGSASR